MSYVCPVCNSEDWITNDKDTDCMSCGNTCKLADLKRTAPRRALNLNEIMPESTTRNQKTFQIND